MIKVELNEKGQAIAPKSTKMNANVFNEDELTRIYWLGSAGIFIHSHKTNLMIDPVLEGFDLPLLYEVPMACDDVQKLDGILITHIDNDHFSRLTCTKLKPVCSTYHAPNYVADVMKEEQYNVQKHDIHEIFELKDLKVRLTPAKHNWQNDSKKWQYRVWEEKDYCGYWFDTEDGTIWLPGDSRLLEEHLQMPNPDVILFDFADNEWHITLQGAIKLANTYPNADLICIHWGSVDAPDMSPFNGNPNILYNQIINPERIKVLAPGEEYIMKKAL